MGDKVEYPKFLFKSGAPDVVAQTFESHQAHAAEGYLTADEYDALPRGAAAPVVFEALSAVDAIALVEATADPDVLRSQRAAEENRQNGGRKTVLRALADKLGDSAAADLPAEPDQIGVAGE